MTERLNLEALILQAVGDATPGKAGEFYRQKAAEYRAKEQREESQFTFWVTCPRCLTRTMGVSKVRSQFAEYRQICTACSSEREPYMPDTGFGT